MKTTAVSKDLKKISQEKQKSLTKVSDSDSDDELQILTLIQVMMRNTLLMLVKLTRMP